MHTADTRVVCVAFARGLVRGELHKLQEGAKPGLSFSPPGAAAASATVDRLRFDSANCSERTIALSVLRSRGGWVETSCTSSRTAQNLVCPFHRRVPWRQVPQLIVFASARQIAHSGHSHCLCCVCAGAGTRRAAQAPVRHKPGLSFSPPGAAAASAPADRLRFSPANGTQRTLALSVLRLRGGWGETSCTSSRKAQNLVCPFHRQVPRR